MQQQKNDAGNWQNQLDKNNPDNVEQLLSILLLLL